MKSLLTSIFVGPLLLLGCGGSSTQPDHHAGHGDHGHGDHGHGDHGHGDHGHHAGHDGEHGEEGHSHPPFPPEMEQFHETLRTVWHSEEGETRARMACEHAATLQSRVEPVSAMTAPETATSPEAWASAVGQLASAVQALGQTCDNSGDSETAASHVHDAFHGLFEHLGG